MRIRALGNRHPGGKETTLAVVRSFPFLPPGARGSLIVYYYAASCDRQSCSEIFTGTELPICLTISVLLPAK